MYPPGFKLISDNVVYSEPEDEFDYKEEDEDESDSDDVSVDVLGGTSEKVSQARAGDPVDELVFLPSFPLTHSSMDKTKQEEECTSIFMPMKRPKPTTNTTSSKRVKSYC